MNSTFLQGLWITIIGMSLVFLALGILIFAMMTLDRLFRPVAKKAKTGITEEPSPEEEEIAAIAVALTSLLASHSTLRGGSEQVRDLQLGSALKGSLGSWDVIGRGQQLQVGRIKRT